MPKRILRGRVLAKKQQKTCVVTVSRQKEDPLLGKYYRRDKKYHVHDERDAAQEDDWVVISESRPYSKLKRWVLMSVEKSAKHRGKV